MVFTEIVFMKIVSNVQIIFKKKKRSGQNKSYSNSTLAESFNKFSLLKNTSVIVIMKEVLFV